MKRVKRNGTLITRIEWMDRIFYPVNPGDPENLRSIYANVGVFTNIEHCNC